MIFILLFLFMVLVFIGLNLYDSSNLNQIKNYLETNNCGTYIYAQGSFKALCQDRLLEVSNSFKIDIKKNSKDIKYKDIKSIDLQQTSMIINDSFEINFRNKQQTEEFYENLQKRF